MTLGGLAVFSFRIKHMVTRIATSRRFLIFPVVVISLFLTHSRAVTSQAQAPVDQARSDPKPQSSPARPPHTVTSFYERVAAKLAANPALAQQIGKPSAELTELQWMTGTWEITARVFATETTPEQISKGHGVVQSVLNGTWLSFADSYSADAPSDQGFLTYNPISKKWISLTLDDSGTAGVMTATRWENNRLVFQGPPLELLGETVTLRQTLEKRSNTEYRILNEEQLPTGKWVPLDEYIYRKK